VAAAANPQLGPGSLRAVAEATLNGKPLGVAWKPPFRLPAGTALRAGHNELAVRVANNRVNRLMGGARGGDRVTRPPT